MMTWTEERIEQLRTMWEAGQTASQIAEALGGVSRNAVIGKAHRLELQARPSPVKSADHGRPEQEVSDDSVDGAAMATGVEAASIVPEESDTAPWSMAPAMATDEAPDGTAVASPGAADDETGEPDAEPADAAAEPRPDAPPPPPPPPMMRSVGPGGFVRQSPGEQHPPIAPAPPRRLVPAKPSAEIAGKTSLLDLSDKICKWPLGHPGEPDFHFCGEKVNPGFPYCINHCGHAYQAQLPRRDRRGSPPLPFGGPRR